MKVVTVAEMAAVEKLVRRQKRIMKAVALVGIYRPLARHPDLVALQHLNDAGGRTGLRPGAIRHQVADVERMKAVHIFIGRDRQQHLLAVHLPRQRQLHQDAVDGVVTIEQLNQRQ